jgi:hypothetical protein
VKIDTGLQVLSVRSQVQRTTGQGAEMRDGNQDGSPYGNSLSFVPQPEVCGRRKQLGSILTHTDPYLQRIVSKTSFAVFSRLQLLTRVASAISLACLPQATHFVILVIKKSHNGSSSSPCSYTGEICRLCKYASLLEPFKSLLILHYIQILMLYHTSCMEWDIKSSTSH